MDISLEDFRRHFGLLSDESLLATNREDLVDAAKTCYDEEIERRGLNAEPAPEESGEPLTVEAEAATGEPGGLVSIASYPFPDEARLAWGLLKGAGIQAFLANEKSALGALHLMVPAEDVQTSLQIIGGEGISEEELAAQAEAAMAEEEEYEGEYEERGEGEPET